MSKFRDLTNEKFGRLTAVRLAGKDKWKKSKWLFICDCGNEITIVGTTVTGGNTKSCGCLRDEVVAKKGKQLWKDITGQRFSRLVALNPTGRIIHGGMREWKFLCDCGRITYGTTTSVKNGNKNSCGCYMRDRITEEQRLDYKGQKIGNLSCVEFSHNTIKSNGNKGSAFWRWRCDCGQELTAKGSRLKKALKDNGAVSCKSCSDKRSAKEKWKDLNGKRVGMLTAVKKVQPDKAPSISEWIWKCDCGNSVSRTFSSVKQNKKKKASCGCQSYGGIDRSGERFGSLLALKQLGKKPGESTYTWQFICDCGNLYETRLRDCVQGKIVSCGCKTRGYDNIQKWINGNFFKQENKWFFYVFNLKRFPKYVKPGIAYSYKERKKNSRGEYGKLFGFIELPRIDAWLLEQALLAITKKYNECPNELFQARWAGYKEVRKLSGEELFDKAVKLHASLKELNREKFAIKYIPMTPSEKNRIYSR